MYSCYFELTKVTDFNVKTVVSETLIYILWIICDCGEFI